MAQETVADLAREFRMSPAEALDILKGLGVEVETHQSPVPESEAEAFRDLISEERAENKQISRTTRRHKGVEVLGNSEVRADMRTAEEKEQIRRAADTNVIEIDDFITLRDLAKLLNLDPGKLIINLLCAAVWPMEAM